MLLTAEYHRGSDNDSRETRSNIFVFLKCLVLILLPQSSALAVRHTPATSPHVANSAPSTTRWSADQLMPNLTQRGRPRATIATLPPGTRTGVARCPVPTAPTLLTVSVVSAFRAA
ncbi:hypothetical protein BGW80DRAFT_817012 [Lactifluus volemus]|nr:hypothetical protein BGW80DRAFT_817012 [Lactifluus volemus]